jgi:LAS seventeen-binding protein 5
VNTKQESLKDNERVQECLHSANQARKQIVRYIQVRDRHLACNIRQSSLFFQTVEDEDLIGTLIESNERVIAAIETYDQVLVIQFLWFSCY